MGVACWGERVGFSLGWGGMTTSQALCNLRTGGAMRLPVGVVWISEGYAPASNRWTVRVGNVECCPRT